MAYIMKDDDARARRGPYNIVVIYLLVSLVWIVTSDRALAMLVGEGDVYVKLQTVKGWFFVITTSVMLYVLIKGMVRDLEIQKSKLEAILRGMGEAVFVSDEERRIIMVNEAMEKLSGFKEEELIGHVYSDKLHFVSERTGKELFGIPESIHRKGKAAKPEEPGVLIRKNGQRIAVDGIGAPYKDSKGRVLGGVGVIRDVTEERARDRMKTDFVSLTSHQLRGPLTGIKWFVELLLENCKQMGEGEIIAYLKKVSDSNQRLIDLVNDLLSVSRVESGKMAEMAKIKEWKLKSLIKWGKEETEFMATEKNIEVKGVEDIDEKIKVRGDRTQLTQVFSNLINNAVKFSKEGGEVNIAVKRKRNKAVVSIVDQGVGIPRRQIRKVFEKFFRADNVAKTLPGSGLGLYIVKQLVESHKGKIRIESIESKGTRVYVELPIIYV